MRHLYTLINKLPFPEKGPVFSITFCIIPFEGLHQFLFLGITVASILLALGKFLVIRYCVTTGAEKVTALSAFFVTNQIVVHTAKTVTVLSLLALVEVISLLLI